MVGSGMFSGNDPFKKKLERPEAQPGMFDQLGGVLGNIGGYFQDRPEFTKGLFTAGAGAAMGLPMGQALGAGGQAYSGAMAQGMAGKQAGLENRMKMMEMAKYYQPVSLTEEQLVERIGLEPDDPNYIPQEDLVELPQEIADMWGVKYGRMRKISPLVNIEGGIDPADL